MKTAVSAMLVIGGMFVATVAHSESQVVFQKDGHACRLDYDPNLFVPGALDADNYRRFQGPRPDAYFRVTALANDENMTPEKILAGYLSRRGEKDLVYNSVKGDFLVLSGYRGRDIFYTKIALSADNKTVCVLDIFFPPELKRAFDLEVTRMSHSFAAQN